MSSGSSHSIAVRMREIRGRVARLYLLQLLEITPGYRSNDDVVSSGLADLGVALSHAELLEHLGFLVEKGLVQLERRDDFSVSIIALTRAGQDTAKGLALVEGVERPGPQK